MIRVKRLKTVTKHFKEFKDSEWVRLHPEHYDKQLDWHYWNIKHLQLEAVENRKIVGVLTGELMAGVLNIPEIIIKHDQRGKGIGRMLMEDAEKWARENNCHEIYLVTGTKWDAVDFYKKLGYEIVAKLPKHYEKLNFVLLRKFLS